MAKLKHSDQSGVTEEANVHLPNIDPTHFEGMTSPTDSLRLKANSIRDQDQAQVAANTIKGRASAGTGDLEDLTPSQVATMLPLANATDKGLAPPLSGNANEFLDGTGNYSAPPTGSGEANTASNVGTGEAGVFKQKNGVDIELRKIKAGTNITVTEGTDDITIDATGTGEANDGASVGSGEAIYKQKSGTDIEIKSLADGHGTSARTDGDTVVSDVDIDGQTETTMVDTANDFLLIHDASETGANKLKKVKPENLGIGGGGSFVHDDLVDGTLTADVTRNGGAATSLGGNAGSGYTITAPSGAEVTAITLFATNAHVNGSNELVLKFDNSANSRDRRFSLQMKLGNNGQLVDQQATGTVHAETVSANVTTITIPNFNGNGASGFFVELR